MYDRTRELTPSGSMRVIARHAADIDTRGGIARRSFGGAEHRVRVSQLRALEFGPDQIPLWAFSRLT